MSDNPGTQSGGRLLGLPSEIRVLIYGMVFPTRRIGLYAAAELFRSGQKDNHRSAALLATCRTIYAEAKPVLYENTEFQISCSCKSSTAMDSEDGYSWDFSMLFDTTSDEQPSDEQSSDDQPAEVSPAKNSECSRAVLAAKPLIEQVRKLLIEITLPKSDFRVNLESKNRWYEILTSELTVLSEAPRLKNVHIEFDVYAGAETAAAFDSIMNLLSTVMYRVNPTISIDPSFRDADFEPSSYHDMLARFNW